MSEHITNIKNNYKKMEKEIVAQLNYVTDHATTLGANREYIWKEFFERIIPKKFNIDRSVFIMDSKGNISKEVDLAIYDEQYTPYIFKYGAIKFIPVEAVAAVIECKSSGTDNKSLSDWAKSINMLRTGLNSLVRINGGIHRGIDLEKLDSNGSIITQTSTTPIKILCHMGSYRDEDKNFDIIIKAGKKNLEIKFNDDYDNLFGWYVHLNHYSAFANKETDNENIENQKNDSIKIQKYVESLKNMDNCYNIKENGGGGKSEENGNDDQFIKKDDKSSTDNKGFDVLCGKGLKDYKIGDSSVLSFIFQFNQLLMLINNPLFFPHMDYVKMSPIVKSS